MHSQWDGENLELQIHSEDRVASVTYKFTELITERQSQYQNIRVVEHERLGRTLIIADDVMSASRETEYDQAMLDLLPAGNSLKVLIMGGGDRSLAAELCRLPRVRNVTCCEIDPEVLAVCDQYFPVAMNGEMSKLDLKVCDAFQFLHQHSQEYDVLFDDMTVDPCGCGPDYRLQLAREFHGKWIISQTGEFRSSAAARILHLLQEVPAEFHRLCRCVPSFAARWTFTRYRLQ